MAGIKGDFIHGKSDGSKGDERYIVVWLEKEKREGIVVQALPGYVSSVCTRAPSWMRPGKSSTLLAAFYLVSYFNWLSVREYFRISLYFLFRVNQCFGNYINTCAFGFMNVNVTR